ncbi:MAG: hypothetical protein JWR19_341 [Pedosphaera sp.]|jgi:hypothetical protein|nr:hypothetical protein [Pedosphaera sp.]
MKNRLLIVVDLGRFKAYRVEYSELNTHPRLELLEAFDTVDAHGRLSDKLTDEAGRFPSGMRNMRGPHGYGERHNIQLELNRRTVNYLTQSINNLVKREPPELPVYFAAEKEIHHQILERLEPPVKARIDKVVPEDLTRINERELLDHFASA